MKKFNYVSGLLIEIPTGSGSKLAPAEAHYDGYGLKISCPRRWPGASRHAPQPVATHSAPLPPVWQKGKTVTWHLDLRNDEHQFVLLRFLEHCPLPVDVKVAMAWFSPPCTWVCRRQRMNNKKGFDLAPVARVGAKLLAFCRTAAGVWLQRKHRSGVSITASAEQPSGSSTFPMS